MSYRTRLIVRVNIPLLELGVRYTQMITRCLVAVAAVYPLRRKIAQSPPVLQTRIVRVY